MSTWPHRDFRRRLVLSDQIQSSGPSAVRGETVEAMTGDRTAQLPRYSQAAREDQLSRWVDFLPLRPWAVVIWYIGGLLLVAVHAWLDAMLDRGRSATAWHQGLSRLGFGSACGLHVWTSTLLGTAVTVLSLMIYTLRRHKTDDYRGRYRLWILVAVLGALASLDSTVGLHRLAETLIPVSVPIAGDRSVHAATLAAVIFGAALFVRLVLELRPSPGSLATLTAATLAYLAGVFFRSTPLGQPQLATRIAGCSLLAGHVLFALTLLVYLRHVFLDAQGKLHGKSQTRKRQVRPQRSGADEGQVVEPHEPSTRSGSDLDRSASASVTAHDTRSIADSPAVPDTPLSRRDKKRLKQEQRRRRHAA